MRVTLPSAIRGIGLGAKSRVITALLLLAPFLAGAQGTASISMYDNYGRNWLCGATGVTMASTAAACTSSVLNGAVTTSAAASAVNGVLRATSVVDAQFATTSPNATLGSMVTITAGARWDDRAYLTPSLNAPLNAPAATSLSITFGATGSTSAIRTQGSDPSGGTSAYGQFSAASQSYLDIPVGQTISSGSPPGYPDLVMNSDFVFSMALNGNATSPFYYQFYTFVLASRQASDLDVMVGSAVADFSHTAIPLFYQVLDAQGDDITSLYDVHFVNGMTFGGPGGSDTVPEPSSMALLGTGLVALVPTARRRRKR